MCERKQLNGNQLRELRMIQAWFKNPSPMLPGIPNGWTAQQVKLRKELMELGYLESAGIYTNFYYRLTQAGKEFKG